ncbi:MAG TPA: ATP-binding cassette domain-containing protein [Granulicella sp.]
MAEATSLKTPHHRLAVHRQLGPLRLDVDLTLSAPWTLIFGPSGSGKSSLLRAACGLLDHNGVEFARHDTTGQWLSLSTAATHRRSLSYAPQNSTLFPHLTISENVLFPSQSARSDSNHEPLVEEVLELFEVRTYADRLPRELSGGERQRVNLARAFAVPDAKLMLLDEPFSGVDRAMRDALLPRMQEWLIQHGIPVLSVSHDVDEALLLGAEVVVLNLGSVVRQGPAQKILNEERTRILQILGPA